MISLIIFVFFNLGFIKKYQIFLGDGGSTFLGFLVAWLLIYYSQHPVKVLNPVLTIWCVSLPVFDFMSVFLRRINKRKNPFKPDRNHMHHLLLKLGYSSNISLLILISFSIIFTLIGGMFFSYFGPTLALMIFLLFLIIYVLISNYLYKLSLNLT